jgi:hypothetical protein
MFKSITAKVSEFTSGFMFGYRLVNFRAASCMYWLTEFENAAEFFRTADPNHPLAVQQLIEAITKDTAKMSGMDPEAMMAVQRDLAMDLLKVFKEKLAQAQARGEHAVLDVVMEPALKYYVTQLEKGLQYYTPSANAN